MDLNEYIKTKKISVIALSDKIGCHRTSLYEYMRKSKKPSFDMSQRIYKATEGEVTPYDFFDTPIDIDQKKINPNKTDH